MPTVIGQDPNREVQCNNCGSKLRFQLDEVEAGDPIPYSDEGERHSVITCPTCRKKVEVTTLVGQATNEQIKRACEREFAD